MSKTRKLVVIAILSALSFVLMFFQFPLLPSASFLKIDFSVVPILLGLVLYDLKSAYAVLLLRSVIKIILNNEGIGEIIGLPMNIIALGVFVLAFAMFWKRHKTHRSYILASIVGTIFMTIAMVVLNYFFAIPLYAKFVNFDISKFIGVTRYLIAMVIPFNIVEGVLLALGFAIIYILLKPILKRYY